MISAFLSFVESHLGVAAWIQAFGTLIALAVAIWVPFRIHKSERRELEKDRIRQGQGIALRVMHVLRALDGQIERALSGIESEYQDEAPEFKDLAIAVPQPIEDVLDQLWLMGSAGGSILHAVSTLQTNKIENANVNEIGHVFDLAVERLESVRRDIADALEAIDQIVDSGVRK